MTVTSQAAWPTSTAAHRAEALDGPLRAAVVDTDSGLLAVLGRRLDAAGWEWHARPAMIGVDELVALRLHVLVVDPAVLDVPDAWEELRRICAALPGLGVIVCTAPASVAERVRGLRLGADDWIAKPCHPEELLARMEAVVRRRRGSAPRRTVAPLAAGELEIRADQYEAFARGHAAGLTRREFELIALLAAAGGRVLERGEIYERVWGYAMAHGDRSVDVFVRKLRQKLRRISPDWRYIHTHFGVGYRFAAEAVEAVEAESVAS